jgi:CRISPR/Cas system CSM-associated protein Csm4 (group 5 of RAMP superfamily)
MVLALSELLCYAAIAVVLDRKYRRNARKSKEWTKKWLLKRQDFFHITLLKELRFHAKDWHNFLRMTESTRTYLTLLSMVSPLIQEKKTLQCGNV